MARSSVSRAVKVVDEVGAIVVGCLLESWRGMLDGGDGRACGCRCLVDVGSRRRQNKRTRWRKSLSEVK